jgi:hypothetical protein
VAAPSSAKLRQKPEFFPPIAGGPDFFCSIGKLQ